MYRNKQHSSAYLLRKDRYDCALCALTEFDVIEESNHAAVVKNNYPYDIWEGMTVLEHLMILPKTHTASFTDIPPDALLDITRLITKYESLGYDIYARSRQSPARSVAHHQHTHLIKVDGKPAKAIIYMQKPYILKKI